MSDWPEHEKLHKVSSDSQAVGYFLEMMRGQGLMLCGYDSEAEGYYPASKSDHQILADHFGIDLVKLEDEKQQMLERLRNLNLEL